MRSSVALLLLLLWASLAAAAPADDARAANARGMKLYRDKNYAGAAREFRAALGADPTYVLAHYNLASMAALLGERATVLAELRWLHDSPDPEARKALAKAPSDPDLRSVIDDPEVKKLVAVAADSEAEARMHAWLAGPLSGSDNEFARMRRVRIERDERAARTLATIDNQFGFGCTLEWSSEGRPARLRDCRSADAQWSVKEADIPLRCWINKKENVEDCEGAYHLVDHLEGQEVVQDARFLLERRVR